MNQSIWLWKEERYYCNDSEYKNRRQWANCVAPDQTAPKEQSDQGLHCLPFIMQYFNTIHHDITISI